MIQITGRLRRPARPFLLQLLAKPSRDVILSLLDLRPGIQEIGRPGLDQPALEEKGGHVGDAPACCML